ncbi:NAD-dependent epimerase/dehydratase family protein [Bailinhaonella thermotolerans]|uniref:NAD-dependent epimerase/dehydratase family protein n=1 Tax=Bailinhaonella thermotolerans TaxID=1070861 RepID=A0A3A4BMG7_9ACTN|nr:NAD-dependent epimerase/dehydratase family protein [Bailinhaonella thermotolerans]RJL32212.1 NAD-dependent epimerase/dehydratase family protein [Bailinhaonella thermotolerans]
MKVLVTGAAGFIGGHLAGHLVARGHEVLGLDSLHPAAHPAAPRHLPRELDLRVGDVRDQRLLDELLDGVDAVFHEAAMVGLGLDVTELPAYASANTLGTATLLAAMARRGVPRLILASSVVVYGEGSYDCSEHGRVRPGARDVGDLSRGVFEPRCPRCEEALRPAPIDEDAALEPRNGYAASKVAQEHLAGVWARETGGTAVALRYHNVYGPHMPRDTPYAGVVATFRDALTAGRAPRVYEDGAQMRDFVHVYDVAAANLCALDGGAEGRLTPYNIASGEPHTVADVARALAAATGGPAPLITGAFRLGDARHIVASPARATHDLGFRPTVGFHEGMRDFIATLGPRDDDLPLGITD